MLSADLNLKCDMPRHKHVQHDDLTNIFLIFIKERRHTKNDCSMLVMSEPILALALYVPSVRYIDLH
jgi:hypothetical protein